MGARERYRTIVQNVGTDFVVLPVRGAPRRGVIRGVRATADPTVDSSAKLGSAAPTDLALEIREGVNGVGMGGDPATSVPLAYAFGPLAVPPTLASVTIDSEEDRDYEVQPGELLAVAVKLDTVAMTGPDATVVVTVVIEVP